MTHLRWLALVSVLVGCGDVKDARVDAAPDGNGIDASDNEDAAIDAPIDAALVPAFDVIYGDPWRFSVNDATNDGWFILVANGTVDPDLSTIEVTALSDTHPTAIIRVLVPEVTGTIVHGRAAGKIFVDNETAYNNAIPEPKSFTTSALMTMTLLDSPEGTYDFDVNMMVSVNGISFPLDFLVHRVPVGIVYSAPDAPKRKTVYR